MPRHPDVSAVVGSMPAGVFSKVAHRIASIQGERYPLHVGDSWLEPAAGARMEDLRLAAHPGMHRYTAPLGLPALVGAIARRRGVDAIAPFPAHAAVVRQETRNCPCLCKWV